MKTFLSLASVVWFASFVGPFASAQHYTQVNLVANVSGVALLPIPISSIHGDSLELPAALGGSPITELALALFTTVPEQSLHSSLLS
jgi:hypothetical protein